ncbi:MAG TPA: ATP synthase F1 subunit gamma [bacterium]|mgnify:CR=1 FL=1|nr:ATP synthase F1 subunit gamma [bacterium]
MASLIEVRKKIQSVQNTKKITQAMQLVAASRMKGFQRKALSSRAYATDLLQLLQSRQEALSESPYGEDRKEGKTLFVLLSSDKGLCGALNAKLFRAFLQSPAWKATPRDQQLVITIGRKAAEAARNEGIQVIEAFEGIKETFEPLVALELVKSIMAYWDDKSCKAIHLIAPEYVNPFVFNTTVKQYLPFTDEMLKSHALPQQGTVSTSDHLYEPSQERVIEALTLQVIQSLMTQSFFELKASEYSSRMVAMKNATESAGEQVRSLTTVYNKARQASITQQLAELAGAISAMEQSTL